MKELRQRIARTNNELYRRRQKRKATKKEKKLLKQLTSIMDRWKPTTSIIRMYKEQWIDKLRYKKIKLQKMIEKGKRIRDNATFERDQKSFSRKIESSTSHEGQIPEIEKFVEFLGGTWEKKERTPEMPWMERCEKI